MSGPASSIDPIAATVPGVTSVRPHDRLDSLRIVSATADVAAPLATALAEAGLLIVHLRRRDTDLLELYRRFVPEGSDGRLH